jgi:hypothetical protein
MATLHGADGRGRPTRSTPSPAWREQPVAEPVAGGHRRLHDDRVRAGPAPRDEAQPELPPDPYPCEGSPGRREAGLLDDCGKRCPSSTPSSSRSTSRRRCRARSCSSRAISTCPRSSARLGRGFPVDMRRLRRGARQLRESGFQLPHGHVDINSWYLGFNWLDPVIGKGDTPEQQKRNRKLRQAISIAIDWEEGYGRIFRTRAACRARPGAARRVRLARGHAGGLQPDHAPQGERQAACAARSKTRSKLMAEAGYPDGRDAKTGKPLVLNYDFQRAITPEFKAENDWMVKQFAKIGIQLEVRATDFNQFQDKILKGKHQIFWYGWLADYPDAENFLFLLYGPNSKSLHEGENVANYENPEFDRLYRKLQSLEDGPQKQKVIDEMVRIAREDSPWAWGYWPYSGVAFQRWVHNGKPGIMVRDMARYLRSIRSERTPSRPRGTGRSGGRCCCWRPAGWRSCRHAPRLAGPRAGHRCSGERRLSGGAFDPSPPGLRPADPDRRQPVHLLPVLLGQHAGRHGAPEHRRQARHAGADREVEGPSAATTSRCTWNARQAGRRARHPHHPVGAFGLAVHAGLRQERCAPGRQHRP